MALNSVGVLDSTSTFNDNNFFNVLLWLSFEVPTRLKSFSTVHLLRGEEVCVTAVAVDLSPTIAVCSGCLQDALVVGLLVTLALLLGT